MKSIIILQAKICSYPGNSENTSTKSNNDFVITLLIYIKMVLWCVIKLLLSRTIFVEFRIIEREMFWIFLKIVLSQQFCLPTRNIDEKRKHRWIILKAICPFPMVTLARRHFHVQSYNRINGTRCEICSKLTIKTPNDASKSPYLVWIRENKDQKKLRIQTLFTHWYCLQPYLN